MAKADLRLSSRVDANGKSQVIVKLTIGRSQRPCFKSGVFIRPEWFKPVQETKRGFVYGIVPPKRGRFNLIEVQEANEAKAKLDAYISRLARIENELGSKGEVTREAIEEALALTSALPTEQITAKAVEDARDKKDEADARKSIKDKSFFGLMELYLEKKQLSYNQTKGYRVLIRALARYQGFIRMTDRKQRNFTLDIDKIDKITIEDFFEYLENEKSLGEEYPAIFEKLLSDYPVEIKTTRKSPSLTDRGENTIRKLKKRLKAFFHWLQLKGYTDNDPFNGIEIGSEVYGTPYYLTLEERNLIAEADLRAACKRLSEEEKEAISLPVLTLMVQRDIFIFQCLIGCRVGDLMKMTPENWVGEQIEYIAGKTKDKKPVTVKVPLNSRAKALVDKYKGVDRKDRLFPFISSQRYNDAIKDVLTLCGVKRMVTILNPTTGMEEHRPINEIASSHMARRTFIGNLYKKVQDPNLIGALSGHAEGSRAFARYRDIDDEIKKETVSLID